MRGFWDRRREVERRRDRRKRYRERWENGSGWGRGVSDVEGRRM